MVGFTDDYLKISKKNSKGLSGRYKLLGQLLTTGVLLFMVLGPLSEVLTGLNEGAIGSADKMRELWVPFYKDPIYIAMPILLVFLFS